MSTTTRRLRAGSMGAGSPSFGPQQPPAPPSLQVSPPPVSPTDHEKTSDSPQTELCTLADLSLEAERGPSHSKPLNVGIDGDRYEQCDDDDDDDPPLSPNERLPPTSPLSPEQPHALSIADLAAVDELDARPREPEVARPRAHELTSSLRVVPHIDWRYSDKHEPHEDLVYFFSLCDDLDSLLQSDNNNGDGSYTSGESTKSPPPTTASPQAVLRYVLLGGSSLPRNEALEVLRTRTLQIMAQGVYDSLPAAAHSFAELSLWALAAVLGGPVASKMLHDRQVCSELINDIAKERWASPDDSGCLGARFALLRLALAATLGDEHDRQRAERWNEAIAAAAAAECVPRQKIEPTQQYKARHANPAPPPACSSTAKIPSYTDYEAFRQTVQLRYPAYCPPPSPLPPSVAAVAGSFTNTPVDPLARGPSVAAAVAARISGPLLSDAAPTAVAEACALFLNQARASPAAWQLWAQQHPREAVRPWSVAVERYLSSRPECLDRVDTLYRASLRNFKSMASVASSLLLEEDAPKRKTAAVHGAAASLLLLLRWLRTAHVLQHEYLAAVLYDMHFYLLLYRFCAQHPILETVVHLPKEDLFAKLAGTTTKLEARKNASELSSTENSPVGGAVAAFSTNKRTHAHSRSHTDGVLLDDVCTPLLETFVALASITRDIVADKLQRIVAVAELPAEPLKKLLMVYNHDLWQAVLGLFKMQAPLNGKKWRCMNMDIVSAIYLHCDASLNDDWLAGTDVIAAIEHGSVVEDELREAVAAYNVEMLAPQLT